MMKCIVKSIEIVVIFPHLLEPIPRPHFTARDLNVPNKTYSMDMLIILIIGWRHLLLTTNKSPVLARERLQNTENS